MNITYKQVAIDNAKRRYEVDLVKEIPRIQKDLDIDKNGLPLFWKVTKKDKRKARSDEERRNRNRATRKKIEAKTNPDLICPMNYLYKDVKFTDVRSDEVIPLKEFFINHSKRNENRKTSKKVEQLIQKYSLELYLTKKDNTGINCSENWEESSDAYMLQADYEKLIEEVRSIHLSNNYLSLMSWLLNRGLNITSGINSNHKVGKIDTTLNSNQALLTKVLYDVNPSLFLQCFKQKGETD